VPTIEPEEDIIDENYDPPTIRITENVNDNGLEVYDDDQNTNHILPEENQYENQNNDMYDEIPQLIEDNDEDEDIFDSPRYNLRSKKKYEKTDLTWEYGLNITTKKGYEQFGNEAHKAVYKEIKQIYDVNVWHPVFKEYAKRTGRNIIRSLRKSLILWAYSKN
jgi:hypothetical protein